MSAEDAVLLGRVRALEERLSANEKQHERRVQKLKEEMKELRKLATELEEQNRRLDVVGHTSSADHFTRRVEWTIGDFSAKSTDMARGQSIWSPKFRACGLDDLQLEFFPKGREKTTYEGFCSLFLWCPSGTNIKYQLWVGSFQRAPDEDEYNARIGHGHSNFCPLAPEVQQKSDSITVGVDFLQVSRSDVLKGQGIELISTSLEAMVAKEAKVLENNSVNKVVWKISKISERLEQYPRGASLWSPIFTVAGIREILLEFYPNGSSATSKDGFCAFYIRCPEGVSMIVSLMVGKVKKGPIKTTFEGLTGKGLPEFCLVKDEIDTSDDSLQVGIEVQNQPGSILTIES